MRIPLIITLLAVGVGLFMNAAHAQLPVVVIDAAKAGALDIVPAGKVPKSGTFYSWQRYWQPPLPANQFPELTVYDLGGGRFLIDDRLVDYSKFSPAPGTDAPASMTAGVENPMSAAAYGCAIWLQVNPSTNNRVLLTVHNTLQGQSYQIWSSTNLATTNWVAETNLTGASGNFTQTLIPMTNRPMAFFKASATRDYLVDTNSTFLGLNNSDTQLTPPDSMGAVGPNHFIELLNGATTNSSSIAVYDKSGNLVAKTNILAFFRINASYPSGNRMVDPRILYDHRSQCWVACALDNEGSGQVILAVSTNAAPTNFATGWTRHLIQVKRTNHAADFPTLGLDDNGLYIAVFHLSNTNGGHTVVAIKKPEIYQGTVMTNRLEIYPSNSLPVWIAQPVVNFDPVSTNAYAWLAAKGPPDLGTNYQGGALCYRRLQWTNGAAAWRDTNWVAVTNFGSSYRDYYDLDGTNVTVGPAPGTGVSAPHPVTPGFGGQPIDLHVPGSRLAMTVIRDSFLWTCQAIGLSGTNGVYLGNSTGTNVNRSGIQWLRMQVDSVGGSLSYNTHGRVYDRAATNAWYYYFPSLMVNCAGDMVMGFSGSSATNYIGAFYSARLAGGWTADAPK